ncbi:BRO-A [Alphabaculovirus myunipunctae]|uniref:BRO-A n=1 Tax=Mythimna unipuncta nucleopolyhedrovirus TaxID=447897 RepID=A0A2K9VS60_9ABAC|nr:BRO-A [Mythimna unipuncta nucleopolyhedrovirus]AUV65297.1 BRO-A [Mythimna unipuncta nucleopolyhedrovirus]
MNRADEVAVVKILTEGKIRANYRANMDMVRRNDPMDRENIQKFLSRNYRNEDDAVGECLGRTADERRRVHQRLEMALNRRDYHYQQYNNNR